MYDNKDPFGFAPSTYLWVIGIALVAGLIRNLNTARRFSIGLMLIDGLTSAFTGLIMFWICAANNITGHWMAVFICVAGLMGSRAWLEFENMMRSKFGVKKLEPNELADRIPMSMPVAPAPQAVVDIVPNTTTTTSE